VKAQRIIRRHFEMGTVTESQLADAANRSHATAYRWARSERPIDISDDDVTALVKNAPAPLSDDLHANRMSARPNTPLQLDQDGDGDVDLDDLRNAKAQVVELIGADAVETCRETSDGAVTADEASAQLTRQNAIIRLLRAIAAIAAHLVQTFTPRRQCRRGNA
jgi:hypothetical protein